MLFKKLVRDMVRNRTPYISMMILSFLALFMYTGMMCSNIGIREIRSSYHEGCNLAALWVYGSDFTVNDIDQLADLEGVRQASLRMQTEGESKEGNPITLYAEKENTITKPYTIEGEDFDENSASGIWLNSRYAQENEISVGEELVLSVDGAEITEVVKGLIMTPEYEYYKRDGDTEPDFSDIGYAYMSTDAYEKAMGSSISYNQITVTIETEANADEVKERISKTLGDSISQIILQEDFTGIQTLSDELQQHDMFAVAFPAVFVIVSVLTIITTMGRMILKQRTQIGTMKAIGVKKNRILLHYTSYGLVAPALGSLLGLIAGPVVMGPVFNDFMPQTYTLPEWDYAYSWTFYVMAVLVVVLCVLSAYVSCESLIRKNTLEILYARTPGKATHCIFEKLPFWERLRFSTQYNLRDLCRAKLRSVIVVIGIFGGMLLMEGALGSNDTVNAMKSWMFEEIQNYEYAIRFSATAEESEKEEIASQLDGELVMMCSIEVYRVGEDTVTSSGILNALEGKGFYQISDPDMQVVKLESGEVAISLELAEKLGIQVGDEICWKLTGTDAWHTAFVNRLVRDPNGSGITVLAEDLSNYDVEFQATYCYTDADATTFADNENVTSVTKKSDIEEAWANSTEGVQLVVMLFILFAFFLVVIVLQNAAAMLFNERNRELATLKVMGVGKRNLRSIMMMQNIWLTGIGILLALPFVRPFLVWMFETNGGGTDYVAQIRMESYVVGAGLVFVSSVLINVILARRIKKIDMVESLKTAE